MSLGTLSSAEEGPRGLPLVNRPIIMTCIPEYKLVQNKNKNRPIISNSPMKVTR